MQRPNECYKSKSVRNECKKVLTLKSSQSKIFGELDVDGIMIDNGSIEIDCGTLKHLFAWANISYFVL